jgi:hypothetical protein
VLKSRCNSAAIVEQTRLALGQVALEASAADEALVVAVRGVSLTLAYHSAQMLKLILTVGSVIIAAALIVTIFMRPEARIDRRDTNSSTAAVPGRADPARGASGRLDREQADAATASDVMGTELTDTGDAALPVDRIPIPLSPERMRILEQDEEMAAFFDRLEREPRDAVWSGNFERFLEDSLISKLDLANYNIDLLECRSQTCVLLATGYGDDAVAGWFDSMGVLLEDESALEALMGGPGTAGCGVGDLAPGVYALNCSFIRTGIESGEEAPPPVLSLDAPYPQGIVVEPIEVSDVIGSVIESSEAAYDWHRQLEQEATDPGWSTYIEPLITNHLLNSELPEGMSLIGLTCRSSLCEVQLTSNGIGEDEPNGAWIAYMLEFGGLYQDQLTMAGWHEGESIDGELTGLVWYLERGSPAP